MVVIRDTGYGSGCRFCSRSGFLFAASCFALRSYYPTPAALDGHILLITDRLMAIMPQSQVSMCNFAGFVHIVCWIFRLYILTSLMIVTSLQVSLSLHTTLVTAVTRKL